MCLAYCFCTNKKKDFLMQMDDLSYTRNVSTRSCQSWYKECWGQGNENGYRIISYCLGNNSFKAYLEMKKKKKKDNQSTNTFNDGELNNKSCFEHLNLDKHT